MADVDPNEEHVPVRTRTRLICSCGDYNCASLDYLGLEVLRGKY